MKASLRIFYLDDDRDDLYFFRNAVDTLGHKVSTFSEGRAMLRTLATAEEKPDIIFLDVHMPIVNGEEILNVIKKTEAFRHLPIVMISTAFPPKLVRQFIKSGASCVMKRPCVAELKQAVHQILSENFPHLKSAYHVGNNFASGTFPGSHIQ